MDFTPRGSHLRNRPTCILQHGKREVKSSACKRDIYGPPSMFALTSSEGNMGAVKQIPVLLIRERMPLQVTGREHVFKTSLVGWFRLQGCSVIHIHRP